MRQFSLSSVRVGKHRGQSVNFMERDVYNDQSSLKRRPEDSSGTPQVLVVRTEVIDLDESYKSLYAL